MHQSLENTDKGLYICNNCSHYYLIGYNKNRIIFYIFVLSIIIFIDSWDILSGIITFIFIYCLIKESIDLLMRKSRYPILKNFYGKVKANDKQLEGIYQYEVNKLFRFFAIF